MLEFSADVNLVAIADMQGIRFVSLASGTVVHNCSANDKMVKGLAAAIQQSLFAVGNKNGSVDLVRVVDGQIFSRTWKAHASMTFALAFSPDAPTLVTGGADQMIHRWDVATYPDTASARICAKPESLPASI